VRVLDGSSDDFNALVSLVGEARFVLIGEATHGTHEFYRTRAQITKRLICEKGFNAVVVEADWPDAWRVNRFVRGFQDDEDAADALDSFKRFPQWMWRNADVLDFVGWLRQHNDALRLEAHKCGFYGMDLYSLHGSIRAVLDYLDRVDHTAASRARFRYSCFEHFGEDPQAYGYAASFDMSKSCEDEVVQQLVDLQKHRAEYVHRRDGRDDADEQFVAEQNARLVKNAEQYYRSMFRGRISSWNLRDSHMVQTLDALVKYLDQRDGRTRCVVWAHNSHLGDARATEMGDAGEHNVGQLVRERWPDQSLLVGFSTYTGTVTAASEWDGPAERKHVQPGLDGSYEALFHETGIPRFMLDVRDSRAAARDELHVPRLQRAIGVIYLPHSERLSHYFRARLAEQFDVMIHFDETRAVEPLEKEAAVHREPETYPTGV
jgi:erythromycin esterase-like protein